MGKQLGIICGFIWIGVFSLSAQPISWLIHDQVVDSAQLLLKEEALSADSLAWHQLQLSEYLLMYHLPSSERWFKRFRGIQESLSPRVRAYGHLVEAKLAQALSKNDQAFSALDRGDSLVNQLNEPELYWRSQLIRAELEIESGFCEAATGRIIDALAEAERSLDPGYALVTETFFAVSLMDCEEFQRVLEVSSPLIQRAKEGGNDRALATLLKVRAFSHYRLLHQDQDSVNMVEALQNLPEDSPPSIRAAFMGTHAAIKLGHRDFSGSVREFRRAIELAQTLENEAILGSLYFNLGIAHSGQAYINKQPLDSSIAILKHGAELLRRSFDYEMLHRIEAILAGTLFVNENQEEAFFAMRSAYLTLDTLHTQNAEARLQDYYSQYQTEKVKRELLETQVNLSNQRQRSFYLFGSFILLGLLGLVAYLLQRIKLQRQRNEAEKRRIELEYGLLRTQMNPHFIFNALNSIQGFFVDRDFNRGNEYLGAFAMLMRQVLDQSTKSEVSLEEELDSLHLYLQLEQARMGPQLSYQFEFEPDLPSAEIMIPPMLLQPFVENAIWHGIAPKEGPGQVWVRIHQSPTGDALLVEIEDDGVGLGASLGRKSNHQPRGLSITRERLGKGGKVELESLKGPDQAPRGTLIRLRIPLSE